MSVRDDDSAPSESLLGLKLHGWKVNKKWPELFTLWIKGKQVRAELSPELQEIENALRRRHHIHSSKEPITLSSALVQLAVLEMTRRDASAKLKLGTFEGMSVEIVRDLLDAGLGKRALELLKARPAWLAKTAAGNLMNLVSNSVRGMVQSRFPSTQDDTPKELLAIRAARMLCEHFQRLPTKREVRLELEALGIAYNKPKDPDGPWRALFARAGLSLLPD